MTIPGVLVLVCCLAAPLAAQPGEKERFGPKDVFDLEYASDPRISPDGARVVYVRNFMDVMKDRPRSNLWIVGSDGSRHRALTTGTVNHAQPRWSPDGTRLLYVAGGEEGGEIRLRWMDTGQEARLASVAEAPRDPRWSPDGRWIAFAMLVPEPVRAAVEMPAKPEGADWGPAPRYVDRLLYRSDGEGYLKDGHVQVFVLPAEGGTPRQLTRGPFHHGAPVWTPDGKALLVSANRRDDWEYQPLDSEIYEISVADGAVRALTDRRGPDHSPAVSPDGRLIAYTGFDDRRQSYQLTRLYVMDREGGGSRLLTAGLDRDVEEPVWSRDGRAVFFQYDDHGQTRIASVSLSGAVSDLAEGVGQSLDRPYSGGSFTVAGGGRFAYTYSSPDRPADVAVGREGGAMRVLTALNEDLWAGRELGVVEEIVYPSSLDGRSIQGWIVKPPGFDPSKKYPLILEIHGGPFANYGPRFAADMQLYASAGYVVLYTNPRGSTSYGEEFASLIHHAYPGGDYDDLMSGVDAVVGRGYVDPERLFVTGGSGGGVLTSWIIGKTKRFRAAAVQKPVINWYSFVLTADHAGFFARYWFPGFPWEVPEHYLDRSPISLVGEVETPTLLVTGEVDYRTPISETEQYYQALKLRKVPAAMVRIPGASHGIDRRPSHLVAKVAHILAWFEKHGEPPAKAPAAP